MKITLDIPDTTMCALKRELLLCEISGGFAGNLVLSVTTALQSNIAVGMGRMRND